MAKVTGPLLSLGARGKFGGALVFGIWKGIPTVRQYVTPANPQTAGQTSQRNAFSASVSAYRNYATDSDVRSAWSRLAGLKPMPQSGFNAFTGEITPVAKDDADASIVSAVADDLNTNFQLTMVNLDDGATGDEAGNFIIRGGTAADDLADLSTTSTIAAGELTIDLNATMGAVATDVVYVEVLKVTGSTRQSRSGVLEVTLT
jgi:hypothetical protein